MAAPEEADALYGLPLEDFVAERDALAKRLRGEGRREDAQAVKALAKPTVAAWAVNQAVRARPREARARLGMPLAFADCEDYERVDEREEAVAMGPRLHGALSSLPSEQRRALQLRVVHGLPYEEVAGRLGCSQNAARLRVSRGLRALTVQLRGAEA